MSAEAARNRKFFALERLRFSPSLIKNYVFLRVRNSLFPSVEVCLHLVPYHTVIYMPKKLHILVPGHLAYLEKL